MTTSSRLDQYDKIHIEARTLFAKKNADYGDAFADYGPIGVLVRIGDKLRRAQNIHSEGITLIDTETVRDTLVDLHNYTAMAVMLLDESKES